MNFRKRTLICMNCRWSNFPSYINQITISSAPMYWLMRFVDIVKLKRNSNIFEIYLNMMLILFTTHTMKYFHSHLPFNICWHSNDGFIEFFLGVTSDRTSPAVPPTILLKESIKWIMRFQSDMAEWQFRIIKFK